MKLMANIQRVLRGAMTELRRPDSFPFKGFTRSQIATRYIDLMSDDDLQHLNALLPWKCFTVDSHGRRFGNVAWRGKREVPQDVPDSRIQRMDQVFQLRGKHVLEMGCFEGVHTVGLCQFGATVTAIDARIENVAKTIVRSAMFGFHPSVLLCDLDSPKDLGNLPQVDLIHHVGVLYHLKDPIHHLLALGKVATKGLMLDTHIATPETAQREYELNGKLYRYKHYNEKGRAEVFSGMYDHAKWLLLSDIQVLLKQAGFTSIDIVEERQERNGPRILLFASR